MVLNNCPYQPVVAADWSTVPPVVNERLSSIGRRRGGGGRLPGVDPEEMFSPEQYTRRHLRIPPAPRPWPPIFRLVSTQPLNPLPIRTDLWVMLLIHLGPGCCHVSVGDPERTTKWATTELFIFFPRRTRGRCSSGSRAFCPEGRSHQTSSRMVLSGPFPPPLEPQCRKNRTHSTSKGIKSGFSSPGDVSVSFGILIPSPDPNPSE